MLLSAGSSEEDLDDIIDEICNDSSFTKTPLVSKGFGEIQNKSGSTMEVKAT